MSYYIQSISGVLDKYNVNFIVGDTKDSAQETVELLSKIAKRGSDGVIIQVSPEAEYDKEAVKSAFEELTRAGIPFVQIDAAYDKESASFVIMDEEKIGELATTLLRENGHERVAIITIPNNRIADMRMGYARKNFPYVKEISFDCDISYNIRKAYEDGITAFFCFNDQIAKDCLDAIHSQNLSIPDDVSLVSVDDTIVSNLYNITSITHAKGDIGEIAAQAVVNGKLPLKKVFAPTLTNRKSVKKIN